MEINRFKQLLESTLGDLKPLISEQNQKTNVKEIYVTKEDYNTNLVDINNNNVRFKFTITNPTITNDTNEGFKDNLCIQVNFNSIGVFSGNTFYPQEIDTITFKWENVKKFNQDLLNKLVNYKSFCKVIGNTDGGLGYAYFRNGQSVLKKINYYNPDPFNNLVNVTKDPSVVQKTPSQTKILTGSDGAYDYKFENGKYYFKGKGTYAAKHPNWTLAKTVEGIKAIKQKIKFT